MRIDSQQLGIRPLLPLGARLRLPFGAGPRNIPIGPPVYRMRLPVGYSIAGLGDACPSGFAVNPATGVCTETPEFRIQGSLEQYLEAAALGQYGDPPPTADQILAMVTQDAAVQCSQSVFPCDPNQVNALVSGAQSQYQNWLANTYQPGTLVYAQPAQQPPVSSGPPPPSSSGGASQPASVQLVNTTRPGQPFRIGDSFSLVVSGAPNQTVTGSSSQNGSAWSTTTYGQTNGSGQFTITGTMVGGSEGNWAEIWTVGGVQAPQLTFSVTSASSALPPPPPATGGGSNAGSNAGANAGSANTGAGSSSSSSNTGGNNNAAPFDPWATYIQPHIVPIGIALGVLALIMILPRGR